MATRTATQTIGPRDVGRKMTLDDFIAADSSEGFLCELARGVVVELEMPGLGHGRTVGRVADLFSFYEHEHPGRIHYCSGGAECRISLPGLQSHRRPDQAIDLLPEPTGPRIWQRWIPQIVVEIVNRDSEHRDHVEKREEYLRFGVVEYWIFDPKRRKMMVLKRQGDTWFERELGESQTHRTELLPGLLVSVGKILGPSVEGDEELGEDLAGDDDPPTV